MNRKGYIYVAMIILASYFSSEIGRSQTALFDSLKSSIDTLEGIDKAIKLQESALLFEYTSLNKAEYFLNESETLLIELGEDSLLAANFNHLGNLYSSSGLFDQAETQYIKALDIYKEINSPHGKATETHNLGIIYLERNDTIKTIDYFKQSLDARHETNNNRRVGDGLTSLGEIYMGFSMYEKSIDCLTRAIEYYISESVYQRKFECFAFLADNYLFLDPEKSLFWIEEMENMLKLDTNDVIRSVNKIYFRKGQYNLKTGNYHESAEWFEKIDLDSIDLVYDFNPLSSFRELSESLLEAGELVHSLELSAAARKYKRRSEDNQISTTIDGYRARLELLAMEEEIQRTQELNSLVLKRLQTEKLLKYALFLILLILSATVSALMLNFMKLKKDQSSLSKRNKELNNANEISIAYKDNILRFRENKSFFFNILTDKLLIPFTELTEKLAKLSSDAKKSFNKKAFLNDLKKIYILSTSIEKSLKRILVWSKLQRKKYELNPELININDYLHELLPEILKLAVRRNIKVSFDTDPGLNVLYDRKAFRSIIKIFIENGIESSSKNSEIIIRAKKAKNGGIVSVTDFGSGIHPDLHDRLFDINSSKDNNGNGDNKKLGLGLLMSKHLAEINNSYISFESTLNKGTTFYLHIKKEDAGKETYI